MGMIILMLVDFDESSINKFNSSLEQQNMCSQYLLSTMDELMQDGISIIIISCISIIIPKENVIHNNIMVLFI
jgi:hypothetical protein